MTGLRPARRQARLSSRPTRVKMYGCRADLLSAQELVEHDAHGLRQAAAVDARKWWKRKPAPICTASRTFPTSRSARFPRPGTRSTGWTTHTKLIHYTNGGPWFPQYANHPHAAIWYAMRDEMYEATRTAVRMPHFAGGLPTGQNLPTSGKG